MKHYGKLFFIALFAICACKKKEGDNQHLDPNNQEETNYMSTKAGSWWLFGARNGDVVKRVATGKKEMKNGLEFDYFERLDTNANNSVTKEYFAKNDGKYLSLYDFDGSQTNYATLVFLKDSVKAGTKWPNTQDYKYGAFNLNLSVESEVEFVGGTLVLGSNTFKDVTKVHNDLEGKLKGSPAYTKVGTIDIWFAKGIGIIKEDVDIKILTFASKQHTDSLLDYHIEQ